MEDGIKSLRHSIQRLISFIKESVDKPHTSIIQAEFEIMYKDLARQIEKANISQDSLNEIFRKESGESLTETHDGLMKKMRSRVSRNLKTN
jgi:hypothetical protein